MYVEKDDIVYALVIINFWFIELTFAELYSEVSLSFVYHTY